MNIASLTMQGLNLPLVSLQSKPNPGHPGEKVTWSWSETNCLVSLFSLREGGCNPKPFQEGLNPLKTHWSHQLWCHQGSAISSSQMRVWAFLDGTATGHLFSSGLAEGKRQDRDLALVLHHHMPGRIPYDRYRSADAYILPGGVTVFLLLFPINN